MHSEMSKRQSKVGARNAKKKKKRKKGRKEKKNIFQNNLECMQRLIIILKPF